MTQEVQPLTWSKRTNIEEHQQFFSKINEIIGNLAPTVDEAEQAIAQATAAIASANDAVATANAASAAASAAASQAQTAASTVAGYDGRLTAAEGDIETNIADIIALQGRMGTAEGNITSLSGRMSAAETKNSQQDNAITELQTADGQNVKINNVNQYAVGLTGNQDNIAGKKVFLNDCTGTSYFGLTNKRASFSISDRSAKNRSWFRLVEDINSNALVRGFYDANEDGTNQFTINMEIDVGGTTKSIEVIGIVTDASGVVSRVSVGGRSIKP